MKILRIIPAILLVLSTAFPPADAAVSTRSAPQPEDPPSAAALRALLTRCLPEIIKGGALRTTGLTQAGKEIEKSMLGDRTGAVWADWKTDLLMIDYHDVPVCRIIALYIDATVLVELVSAVFAESISSFRRERYRLEEDGSFAVVYSGTPQGVGVVIRISTSAMVDGSPFATLSVEREVSDATATDNGAPAE